MATTLAQYRNEIRTLLRDSSYPESDVDSAINRIVLDINSSGRYRFHEATHAFNLSANNYTYAVPGNCLGEKVMLYAAGNNTYQKEVPRKREIFAYAPQIPTETGNAPTEWARYGNNWYIYPIPNSTMVTNGNMTVIYDKDLVTLLSPTDSLALPDRHRNVIIYGAVSQLRPNLLVSSPKGDVAVTQLYVNAFRFMQTQEHWDMASIPHMKTSPRFSNMSSWGYVSRIR